MQAYMFSVIINITIKYMYIVDWKYKMQTIYWLNHAW